MDQEWHLGMMWKGFPELSAFYLLHICKVGGGIGVKPTFLIPWFAWHWPDSLTSLKLSFSNWCHTTFLQWLNWTEIAQSCRTLCDPMDCSLPGSSIHEIFQARVLEWVAISFSRGSSQPRDRTLVSRITGRRFKLWATREALCMEVSACNSGDLGSVLGWGRSPEEGNDNSLQYQKLKALSVFPEAASRGPRLYIFMLATLQTY